MEKVIVELIGTWLVVGFFSAIGWGVAQKTVVEPYVNPAFDQPAVIAKDENVKN